MSDSLTRGHHARCAICLGQALEARDLSTRLVEVEARAEVAEARATTATWAIGLAWELIQSVDWRRESPEWVATAQHWRDRYVSGRTPAVSAEARVKELEGALWQVEDQVTCNEDEPTSVLISIGRIVRAALAKKGGGT